MIGGGAAAVSSAAHVAQRWLRTRVDLYFPGDRGLPHHHPRVWHRVRARLDGLGVGLHPGHRAALPPDGDDRALTAGPVAWSTGQAPTDADVVLWAIGRVTPHTAWLPRHMLDDRGFVRVLPTLQVPGHPEVFAVGDVAATDPLRTSARNRGHRLVAHNIRAPHRLGGPWFARTGVTHRLPGPRLTRAGIAHRLTRSRFPGRRVARTWVTRSGFSRAWFCRPGVSGARVADGFARAGIGGGGFARQPARHAVARLLR